MESGIEGVTGNECEDLCVGDRVNPVQEDTYWQVAHRSEAYWDVRLDYEDFAPAYCVGYIGYAQYGGSFEDAEKSLWANWERIKGDSRLPFEVAALAMRAAWDRMAKRAEQARRVPLGVRLMRILRAPSFKLSPLAFR